MKILEDHNIPSDQLDAKLREMLGRDEELLERLEAAPAVNPETDQLRKKAGLAIREGDHDGAADLLRQAEARDTQAAAEMDDRADGRRRAAAHFERAARLAKAEPLYERALEIAGDSFGPDHPTTLTIQDNLASMREEMTGND